MDSLIEKYYQKISRVSTDFLRYLHTQIDWKDRLIGIKGARGAGKTTMLLQYIKQQLPQDHQTLYVSLDDLYFTENKLVTLADNFVKQGGRFLLLDEVHRYSTWSQELKNIYDDQPDLKIIFTGSSIMHIDKAKGDLSRRAVMYELFGLSFREYLQLTNSGTFSAFTLDDLISDHITIARQITEGFHPLEHFKNYLRHGYYPYFIENTETYSQKLSETISLALHNDLPALHDISYASVEKIRLLLYVIAGSVPFKPNISKLSERTGATRNTLVQFLKYLEDLRIVRGLYSSAKGISLLQKPEKLYLHHPNLQYALADQNSNTGSVRESFFVNQVSVRTPVLYINEGDFAAGHYLFETGGKGKTRKQIAHLENAYVVADNLEIGNGQRIPLWLFGFLY